MGVGVGAGVGMGVGAGVGRGVGDHVGHGVGLGVWRRLRSPLLVTDWSRLSEACFSLNHRHCIE